MTSASLIPGTKLATRHINYEEKRGLMSLD